MFYRIDIEDDNSYADTYETEQEVMDDAERFYGESFFDESDYDESFTVTSLKQAVDFWEANGYAIAKKLNCEEL